MLGITYIRELYGLTLEDLASKLQITKQAISNWEKGKNLIAESRLEDLKSIFGLPSEYFQKELDEIDKLKIQKARLENQEKTEEKEFYDYEGILHKYKTYSQEVKDNIKLLDLEIDKLQIVKDINELLDSYKFENMQQYAEKTGEVIALYGYITYIYKSRKVGYEKLEELFNAIMLAYKIDETIIERRALALNMYNLIREDILSDKLIKTARNILIEAGINEDTMEKNLWKLEEISSELSFVHLKGIVDRMLFEAYKKNDKQFLSKMKQLVDFNDNNECDVESLKFLNKRGN